MKYPLFRLNKINSFLLFLFILTVCFSDDKETLIMFLFLLAILSIIVITLTIINQK